MRTWLIISTVCLMALFYPGADLLCWDTAGDRAGSYSETSCDGNTNSGNWTGHVTSDCRFIGTGQWASVTGTIDPATKVLTATGERRDGCSFFTMTGTFSSDFVFVTGTYNYSQGGSGSFAGRILP